MSRLLLICIFLPCLVEGNFKLVILHTNDVHAHFEESNAYSGTCKPEEAAEEKCYGGYARILTKVKEVTENEENVLFLDAGDQFQGTLWFTHYQGTAAAHFMELLRYDAMALGNHDFDSGVATLGEFLDNVTFPVLSANLDSSSEPLIFGKYSSSVEITRGGQSIGMIGYTTNRTKQLVNAEGVQNIYFNAEIPAIQEEVDKLKARGVNKIIAVGHAGFDMDKIIASEVKDVDIVIGGHSHTFLYSGDPPSNEIAIGPYPYQVESSNGDKVLVIQDYAYGKYLGYLEVSFNDAGKVDSWTGNPIFLDSSIEQDEAILEELHKWKEPVLNITKDVVGSTYVWLDGDRSNCRVKECNMGSYMTDTMLHGHLKQPTTDVWSNVSIVLWNSGGIRSSIEMGNVTRENVLEVLPFSNTVEKIELYGRYLLEALEHSVSNYDRNDPPGAFLQVSGLSIIFDLSKPPGRRVKEVKVKCTDCTIPDFVDFNENAIYALLTNAFMANGGDGYDVLRDKHLSRVRYGNLASDVFADHFIKHSPIIQGLEKRIRFITSHINGQGKSAISLLSLSVAVVLSVVNQML